MSVSSAASVPGPSIGPFARRVMLSISVAAGLTALCALYSKTVTPLFAPGSVRGLPTDAPTAAPPPPPENVRVAKQYLPLQPWAASAKYQIRTPEAFIYANEWQPIENDQAVMFRPFAMVYMSEGRPADQPPVTVVGESAYLRFSKRFQVSEPEMGRIVAGALQGNSRITGPNDLVIVGKNFTFSEESKRLWSESLVTFGWGQHRGRGFGLQAELIADESARQRSSIAITGVQSLKLRRNVAVDLTFDSTEQARLGAPRAAAIEPKPVDDDPERGKAREETIEVRVRSAGQFEFDVEANVATFHDKVNVYRPTGPDRFDSLRCDQLTLMLEPREVVDAVARAASAPKTEAFEGQHVPSEPKAPEPLPGRRDLKDGRREGNFGNLNMRMTLRQMRARCKPGEHVVLVSLENDLTCRMTDLIYDVPLRKATLSNPDPEGVNVVQGASEIRCPGMTLIHDVGGRITSVWCQGPGWLKHKNPDNGKLELKAEWAQQLRKYPDDETKLDVIELEKQAIVRQPEDKTGLAAHFIRLWIEPQDVRAARPGQSRREGAGRIQLREMLALNEVALVSPEMNASTDRLEVKFEQLPELPADRPADRNGAARRRERPVAGGALLATQKRDRSEIRLVNGFLSDGADAASQGTDVGKPPRTAARDKSAERAAPSLPPAARGSAGDSSKKSDDAKPADPKTSTPSALKSKRDEAKPAERTPIDVEADLIRVRVLLGPGPRATHVAEVWTEGNVEVSQAHGDSEDPLKINGDWMHVENPTRDQADQILHVRGVPAHVRDRGMHIEGRNVHLDRRRNYAWVDGAGLLQLPVDRTLDGQKLEDKQLLDVWWNERMTFDGRDANFFGDVSCVLKDSRILCQSMLVQLSDKISFIQSTGVRPDVKSVDCREKVTFEGKEYVDSRISEFREGEVAEFTYDRTTGHTTAKGPGWMRFWRRGNARRSTLGPNLGAAAPRPATTDPNVWDYTRVDFQGASEGNVNDRHTTFKDYVEIVHGRVDRPPETIDPDNLPKDGGFMRCDQLRIQQHILAARKPDGRDPKPRAADGRPQGQMEVLGSGNAEVWGRTFNGKADTISYDQSKDTYLLRSFGNHKSTVSRQKVVGGDEDSLSSALIRIIPSRNMFETIGVKESQGAQ